ncbi:6-phosphogluconolactonase [Capnocytophaga sp. HP1101]
MYIGSYTEGDNSKGIYTYYFNQDNGSFEPISSTEANNPSFLTLSADGKRLYAVSEYNDGRQGAYSFDVSADGLHLSNPVFRTIAIKNIYTETSKEGADPCHIYTDGKMVVTANYTGGDVSTFPLDTESRLLPKKDNIFFPEKSRDRKAHIHQIVPTPDGQYLLVVDLGNDCIYRIEKNKLAIGMHWGWGFRRYVKVVYQAPDGQGPRHLTFSKNGRFVYLINELGGECIVLSYRKGKLKEVQRLMADEANGGGSAEIALSPDGRFLYTSHRLKNDGISIFAVDPHKGTIAKVGYQHTGVHPRHFALTPNGKYLLVANRDSNQIQIFERNLTTGLLTDTSRTIELHKPTCILFANPN